MHRERASFEWCAGLSCAHSDGCASRNGSNLARMRAVQRFECSSEPGMWPGLMRNRSSAKSSSLKWTVRVANDSNPWNPGVRARPAPPIAGASWFEIGLGTEPRDWLPHPRSRTEDGPGLRVHRHHIVKLESTIRTGRRSTDLPAARGSAPGIGPIPIDPDLGGETTVPFVTSKSPATPESRRLGWSEKRPKRSLGKRQAAGDPCRKPIDRQIVYAISSRRLVSPGGVRARRFNPRSARVNRRRVLTNLSEPLRARNVFPWSIRQSDASQHPVGVRCHVQENLCGQSPLQRHRG